MKKIVYISFSVVMLLVSAVQNGNCIKCPDLECTSFAFKKIYATKYSPTNAVIRYSYTFKNIGTDTLFLKNVVIQNYISPDSNINHGSPAGEAYIDNTSKKYLLPDSSYSSTFEAGTNLSLITNPYLMANIYLVNQTDCNTANNWSVRKIDLKSIGTPDIICTSLLITSINTSSNTTINYDYTIKNIGTDTLFLRNVAIQNYVYADSSITNGSPSGGGYAEYNSTNFILPNFTYSGSYSAGTSQSIASYPFLGAKFYIPAPIESDPNNNVALRRIQVTTSLNNNYKNDLDIAWQPVSKTFSVKGNSNDINKFKVYNTLGNMVISGNIVNNESKVLSLAHGMYIVEVVSKNKRLVKKVILVE